MCDASRLDVFDEDGLTAASCGIQTDHAEAQTTRQRPSQLTQLCVTALGGSEDPLLQDGVRQGRCLMDGRRRAIGQEGGGGGQGGRGRAAGWIDGAHDQLTLFGETEVTLDIGRHAAQLQAGGGGGGRGGEGEEEERFVR